MEKRNSGIHGGATAHSAQSTNQHMQYTHYRTKQGHGWAAEDANALSDTLRGHSVDKVGAGNSCNGADRVVNGTVQIQTKYCRSASESVNAAFSNGQYRYGGMKLEVPKEQYEEAVRLMAEKIRTGQVAGVTDPAVAKDIVIRGNVSYREAQNIAKAGTMDSIKFDAKTQAVTCALTCGISFVVCYTRAIHNGMSHTQALASAAKQSAANGAIALVVGVATQQLLRTSVGRTLGASATYAARNVVDIACSTQLGQRVVEKTASALTRQSLAGEGAKQILVKGMRTNMVVGGVMLAAQTIPDAIRLCQGRISGADFAENTASNVAGIASGYAGATAGAAFGTAIMPGIGTAIGAIVGGIASGMAGSGIVRGISSWLRGR